jgi:restriction endonuclease S subunit
MRGEWKNVRLDELTETDSPITYGVVKPGDPGDVLFIRGGDIADGRILDGQLRTITREVSEQYRRTLLRGGELLISLVGQPGQVAVASLGLARANIARQVGLIRLRNEVDANFVSYFLQSPDGKTGLGTYTGGSVQQVINLGDLRTVTVPVPPSPNSSGSSASSTKRLTASPPPKPTPNRASRTPVRCLKVTCNLSLRSAVRDGWIRQSASKYDS